MTAGSAEQIKAVIEANLVPALLEILTNGDFKTKKEACWAICNATTAGVQNSEIIG